MIDLHMHSSHSDGVFSTTELSAKIIQAGLSYCSLTDHNSVAGLVDMEKIISSSGITFIPGIEFSVRYLEHEIHILVYDFDIDKMHAVLLKIDKIIEKERRKEFLKSIEVFKKEGFLLSDKITIENRKPVGYLLALDIYSNETNKELIIKRHGHLLSNEDFYKTYQAPSRPCYVLKSGLDLDIFLENLENIKCDKILAHPFVETGYRAKALNKIDIDYLIKKGIDGIEIYHSKTRDDQISYLEEYVEKNNLLFTGGSDFHGKDEDEFIACYGGKKTVPRFKLRNYNSC